MTKMKSLLTKVAVFGLACTPVLSTPIHAASSESFDEGITITVTQNEDGVTITEGMVTGNFLNQPTTRLLGNGKHTQYPSQGGTWEYGFWDVKIRSYYTVKDTHGSSVKLNGTLNRSISTASGKKSIAELYAVNYPGQTDEYYFRIGD